ncbi:Lipid phosphate phosphohydrolase 1-like [Oopsacas minuta]|uniref:Lipid phosphate phosphohydrolase 1-like n=1 Tax=Oopsacas minuta TaxID=111878 RepID=A0AAV7JN59_9METZ|nr:Lipid phosphate phosphohydrolase 1-like [Oopsacas minuta]
MASGNTHMELGNLDNNKISKGGITTSYSVIHFVVDIVFLVILIIAGIITEAAPLPVERLGFFCDSETLRFPFLPSTIPTLSLIFFVLIPAAFIIGLSILEHFIYKYAHLRLQTQLPSTPFHVKLHCIYRELKIPYGLWKTMLTLYAFIVGIFLTLVVTNAIKLSVGELRPHFLSICQPNFTELECRDSFGYATYVTNYTCYGTDTENIREARLSFPSGHASFIVYNMVFLMFFLELKPYIPRGIRSAVTLLFALTGMLVAITRLYDYKHHANDVIGGSIIGLVTAIFTYFFHLRLNTVPRSVESLEAAKSITSDEAPPGNATKSN